MTYWIGNKNIRQYLTENELKELENTNKTLKIIDTEGKFDKFLKAYSRFYIKNDIIVGCIVLTYKPEEPYKYIYDGNWLTDSKYMVFQNSLSLTTRNLQDKLFEIF